MIKKLSIHILFFSFIFICWMSIFLCVGAYVILTTTWGGKLAASYLIKLYVPSCNVKVGEYQGTIEKGILLKDVVITQIPSVKDSRIHIQSLYVQVPLLHWDQISFKVFDGRLLLPSSDPVIFNGYMLKNYIKGDCYAHGIDVHELISSLGYNDLAKNLVGSVSHMDFFIQGPIGHVQIKGNLFVDKIVFKDTRVKDGFGRFDLIITRLGELPSMNGFVMLDSALVRADKINIDLVTSKVDFQGDVSDFLLDIHGSSKVEDIMIDMAIKGTFQKPHLVFNSDPPMSEEEIIMTLVTGKGWSEIDNPRSEGFGLRKKLTDAFNVGMEIEQKPSQLGRDQTGYSRTIEGQMNVTDHISVNVAKKFHPTETSSTPSSSGSQPEKDNDTELYLQYKQRF